MREKLDRLRHERALGNTKHKNNVQLVIATGNPFPRPTSKNHFIFPKNEIQWYAEWQTLVVLILSI